ncbi:putative reverse transcriptase [Metarhizium anisopliae]|nr:putative reverse transcriptase [Metarhizium anisopliae]
MSRRPRTHNNDRKTLKIFQTNVGNIPAAHDCALALADSEKYDVVLLQEPWTEVKEARCLTKIHPAYETHSPVDNWENNDARPRVMTYVRKNSHILTDQKRPASTRDTLWLTVNGITIVNVYCRPSYDAALDILLRRSPPERCLVAGDFNAKHYSWQTGRLANRGGDIAAWAAESGPGLLNTADVPTNPHGNTIDLAFSKIDLASAVVEDHLATSSDHFTLSLTILNITLALTGTLGKVLPAAATTASELDALAESLVNLLHSSAKEMRSAPWWTDECAESAAEYHAVRRIFPMGFNEEVQAAREVFQNVVRRAKRQYWRNLIDGFSDSAAVYKAARWLKSPGAFQPPPLQIDGVVYETQMDKANALRRSTLERRTEQTTSTTRGSRFVRRVKYHLLPGSLSLRQKMLPPRLATPRQGQTTSPSRYCEQFGTSLENMSGGYTKVAWWSGITHKHVRQKSS